MHQLPPSASNLRVSTWRRLQQLGALPVKGSVYVLPDAATTREDFEWLKEEVASLGGEAVVFTSAVLDRTTEEALVETFRHARQEAYTALAADVEAALRRFARRSPKPAQPSPSARVQNTLRERLRAIERIDFFASAGRDRVITLLQQLEAHDARVKPSAEAADAMTLDRRRYTNRVWVTRPRPGVDRMASAWLIRRYIDPQASFAFATDRSALPDDSVPFDMYGVEFSHHADRCTFETLCALFGVRDAAVARLAAVVHDLDLKDNRFGVPESATIGALIEGLQLAHADDHTLLMQGIDLFEALYRSFARAQRAPRPAAVARPRTARPRRGAGKER